MKPYLLALASCGALMLSGCGGKMMTSKQPAWVDAQPCQKELPPLVDYVKGDPVGTADTVTIVERGDGGMVNLYVVSPKDGTVSQAVKINADDYVTIVNPFDDRSAGSLVQPTPPPPPGGWDKLRAMVGLASRMSQQAPVKCMQQPMPSELEGKGIQ